MNKILKIPLLSNLSCFTTDSNNGNYHIIYIMKALFLFISYTLTRICDGLFSLTLTLSVFSQENLLDFASAIQCTKEIMNSLRQIPETGNDCFGEIMRTATQFLKKLFEIELKTSRVQIPKQLKHPHSLHINEDILPSFQLLLPGFITNNKGNVVKLCSSHEVSIFLQF